MSEKKPVYKKWWFWLIIVALLFSIYSGNSSDDKNVQTDDIKNATEEDPLDDLIASKVSKNYSLEQKDDYWTITYQLEDTPYDYTDYVSEALTHYVIIGNYVFNNSDCSWLRMDMKDDSGIITSLIMAKENFQSISWKDISFTKDIYNDICPKFEKFYVESMLMKDVITNKIIIKTTIEE